MVATDHVSATALLVFGRECRSHVHGIGSCRFNGLASAPAA